MLFSVLGPLEVRDSGESLPLGGHRQRAVLALLVHDVGRVVAADRILTDIWGDQPPDGARDSLYTYVSNLRRELGRDRITRADGGYRLQPAADDTVDVAEAEALLTDARRLSGEDPSSALELIDRSLSFWRGRPYEGMEDVSAVAPEAARLEELRLSALEDRIDAGLRCGEIPEPGGIEVLTKEHPYRERFWELLAHVLYRAGRQTDALRALANLRRMLADDLGIDPSPSVTKLEERILLQDPALDFGAEPATNLPVSISSFVGRAGEIAALETLLLDHRLITITGPGGAGKTRLAVETAGRIAGRFADGIWLVDLAPVSDAAGVSQAFAADLGLTIPPGRDLVEALAERLRAQTMLIVADNCEHVAPDVGKLANRLLSTASQLRILATSRRHLGASGEAVYPILGLGTAAETNEAGDAQRLFAARAADVHPGFGLDESNRDPIAAICRRVDGLPLAIELAATRVDVLSPSEIDRHLQDWFGLLTDTQTERASHRSLQASLDWSYSLLSPDERRSLDHLGVFDGPFTVDAAAAVFDLESELAVVDGLRRLVTASLVQVIPGTVYRYRLLETVRAYVRQHLSQSGTGESVIARHDRHYRLRCEALRDPVFGSGRPAARQEVDGELADFESSFDRFLDSGDVEEALDMAWILGHVWLFSGKLGRGIDRLERLVDISRGSTTRARADALVAASFLVMYVSRFEDGIAWTDEAIDIYRSVGDDRGLAYALARRGHIAFSVGDVPTALSLLQESLAICDRIGYREGSAWPLTLLGQARLWGGDESDEVRLMLEEGRRRFIAIGDTFGQMHANMFIPNVGDPGVDERLRYAEESIELADRPDADPLTRPIALHNLAFTVWQAGDRERAAGLNRLSARSALEMGVGVSSGMAFLQAATFAGVGGDAPRAAALYGAGNRHFLMQKAPFYVRQLQPGIDAARSKLGDAEFERLSGDGEAMSTEQATEFLLAG